MFAEDVDGDSAMVAAVSLCQQASKRQAEDMAIQTTCTQMNTDVKVHDSTFHYVFAEEVDAYSAIVAAYPFCQQALQHQAEGMAIQDACTQINSDVKFHDPCWSTMCLRKIDP